MSLYDFIKAKEGFSPNAFFDHKQDSIGYGRKAKAGEGPTTREAEDAWLVNRVDSDREYVKQYGESHGYNWNDSQLDALTSFVYNLGRGSLQSAYR